MAFKLAGQNPAIEALIYRPSDRSELQTMELRPGMDGFDGPPTLETIGPYNPSEDTSEIIQLAASNSDPRFAAIEEILPLLVGSSGPGGAKNQQYRPPVNPKGWAPPPPDFREKYMPWEKKADIFDSVELAGSPSFDINRRSGALGGRSGEQLQRLLESGLDNNQLNNELKNRNLLPTGINLPKVQLFDDKDFFIANSHNPAKDQQPIPEKWPSRHDPVKGLRTDWMVDPHMGVVAPFVRRV